MRNVIIVVLVTVAAATLLESRGATPQAAARAGPGQPRVRITAQQLSEAPPSYALMVTNLADAPIVGIVIGRQGLTFPIMGVAANVPVRMDSPPGWVGRHGHVEERPWLIYHWENKDPTKRIAPQQSAASFRITLPEAPRDPEQVTFDRIPFEVSFTDGSRSGGLVSLDRIPK
jgi:hypothetical protein